MKAKHLKLSIAVLLTVFSCFSFSADIPQASAELRAQYVKDYAQACVAGLEKNISTRVRFSHDSIVNYCTCRQNYRADFDAQADKEGKRGKAVADEAYEYAASKCASKLQ
jgi:hypothetical protein